MFPIAVRRIPHSETACLQAVIALQGALIRVLLRLLPTALRHLSAADQRQLAELARPLGWSSAAKHLQGLISATTLHRWFRQFVERRTSTPPRRSSGRPAINARTRRLIVRLARENAWGYRRIVGALAAMRIHVSATSVKRILAAHGIKPVPERRTAPKTWRSFLAAHWSTLASIDFTSVPVLTFTGWRTFHIGVVIILATRKVQVCTVTANPDTAVMQQVARNLTMADTGFLAQHGITHLIHDGGGEFTLTGFDGVLASAGITYVRIPPRSPNCNAHVERFHRSLKEECLDRIYFVGDRALAHVARRYCDFHNHRRPHQGVGNRLIEPDERLGNTGDTIKRSSELGGILNFYHRSVA